MEVITGQIFETLLYEGFGGRKCYRRGYRQVLLGLKNESEIVCSNASYEIKRAIPIGFKIG